ncbi:hypothetical protein K0M31_000948, partial [Melipona bicolor]
LFAKLPQHHSSNSFCINLTRVSYGQTIKTLVDKNEKLEFFASKELPRAQLLRLQQASS